MDGQGRRTTRARSFAAATAALFVFLPLGCGADLERGARDDDDTPGALERSPPVAAAPRAPTPLRQTSVSPGAIAPTEKPPAAETLERGFAGVAARVGPAVVNIQATKEIEGSVRGRSPFDDPFFGPFFGPFGPSPPHRARAQGSGVIISADGIIFTNHHVIEGATDVRVTLSDKRELRARVLGSDPKTDIAVLDVEADGLPFLPLADSDQVEVGDFALAVGNPFGIGQTVTLGIVSATGRGQLGIVDYEDFIQTDAAINPGNSGGALVNTRGELIGIATAIVTGGGGGNAGVGLAVPSKMARAVMQQILTEGRVVRGWLGVGVQDLTPSLAEALRISTRAGALVGDVVPDSPAGRAGLRRGDVILRFGDAPVTDGRALRLLVGSARPGTRATLVLLREGRERRLEVVLEEMKDEDAEQDPSAPGRPDAATSDALGIDARPLTPELRARLAVPADEEGLVVVAVRPGGRGAEAGLRRGDVILEVNQKKVGSIAALRREVAAAPHRVLFLVLRDGTTSYVLLEER
jgi:serine protease Do